MACDGGGGGGGGTKLELRLSRPLPACFMCEDEDPECPEDNSEFDDTDELSEGFSSDDSLLEEPNRVRSFELGWPWRWGVLPAASITT